MELIVDSCVIISALVPTDTKCWLAERLGNG